MKNNIEKINIKKFYANTARFTSNGMKKFSILIFTIITLLTPLFFVGATPINKDGTTILEPTIFVSSKTSNSVTLNGSKLVKGDDVVFYVYNGSINLSKTVTVGTSSTTASATFTGLTPNTAYTGELSTSDYDKTISFTTTANTSATYAVDYVAAANGTIVGNDSQTIIYGGTGTEVTAKPNDGYHFKNWSDGNTSATRTDTNVTAIAVITAYFEATTASSTFNLKYTAGTGGTIVGTSTQSVKLNLSGTPVTATASAGYRFKSWSPALSPDTALRTDSNVTENITAVASFEKIYTLTYTAGPNGKIDGISPQTVDFRSDGNLVTAIPDFGFKFKNWSDHVESPSRTEFDVRNDITVTANFEVKLVFNPLNVTKNSANLSVHGLLAGTIFNITLNNKSNPSLGYVTLNGTVGDNGYGTVPFKGLFPGTTYEAVLVTEDSVGLSAITSFTTPPGDTAIIKVMYLSATSVRLDVTNFPPLTDGTFFIALDNSDLLNPSSYISSGVVKSTEDGTISKEFSGLTTNTKYIGGIQVPMSNGGSYIVKENITPTAASIPLDYVSLNKSVDEATSRLKLNIEGIQPGNYSIGSKAELKKVLNEKYDDSGKKLEMFADQTEINAFNTRLVEAITMFEARKIAAKTIGGDVSSKGGGLVPDCPASGCGFNQLMQLINNLIKFLLFTVATPLAAIIIAYAGWLYLSSGGNPGDVTKAKKILMNVVVGYIIGLAAWLIVKTIVSSLGVDPSINTFLK